MSNRFTPEEEAIADRVLKCAGFRMLERSQQDIDGIKAAFDAVHEAVRKTPINDILNSLPGRVRESSLSRPSTPWICPDSVCSKAAPISDTASDPSTSQPESDSGVFGKAHES